MTSAFRPVPAPQEEDPDEGVLAALWRRIRPTRWSIVALVLTGLAIGMRLTAYALHSLPLAHLATGATMLCLAAWAVTAVVLSRRSVKSRGPAAEEPIPAPWTTRTSAHPDGTSGGCIEIRPHGLRVKGSSPAAWDTLVMIGAAIVLSYGLGTHCVFVVILLSMLGFVRQRTRTTEVAWTDVTRVEFGRPRYLVRTGLAAPFDRIEIEARYGHADRLEALFHASVPARIVHAPGPVRGTGRIPPPAPDLIHVEERLAAVRAATRALAGDRPTA